MKTLLRGFVGLWALAQLVQAAQGCTDPGCIRNSECGTGFSCLEQMCTRAGGDAGTSAPNPPSKMDAAMSTPDQPDEPDDPDLPDEDAGL